MRLYYSANPNPRVAVAVARHLGSPVEYVRSSPRHPDQMEAFRAINPNALVPVLVEGERRLWEADAIACRLCAIAGSDFWRTGDEAPEMIMWVSWSAHHFNSAAGVLYFERLVRPRFSDEPAPASVLAEAMDDFRSYATTLDDHLGGRAAGRSALVCRLQGRDLPALRRRRGAAGGGISQRRAMARSAPGDRRLAGAVRWNRVRGR